MSLGLLMLARPAARNSLLKTQHSINVLVIVVTSLCKGKAERFVFEG
jgi:hypothetical protein